MRDNVLRCIVLFLWFCLLHPLAFAGRDEIEVKYQIYVLKGSVMVDTKLHQNFDEIWDGDDDEWDAIKNSVKIFDEADFHFSKETLRVVDDGIFWNGQELSFDKKPDIDLPAYAISHIHSSIIKVKEYETYKIKIHSEDTLEYFEENQDGTFSLKELEKPTGLEIKLRTKEGRNCIYFDEMWVDIQLIGKREPIPGVSLPIGKPIISQQKYELELRLREHKIYGVLMSLDYNQGFVLICFEADEQ